MAVAAPSHCVAHQPNEEHGNSAPSTPLATAPPDRSTPYITPLASPMHSPALSSSSRKRQRLNSDEEAFFLLEEQEAVGLKAAIEASLGPDMKKRVKDSLQETLADLHEEYPDEMGAQDFAGARKRASSELADLASRLSTPGTAPMASPVLAHAPPPLELPPTQEETNFNPADFQLYEHDGLFDHEQIMQAIYLSQGLDLDAVQGKAQQFLRDIGLRTHDLGVKNTDESGQVMINQCFYLSIAHGFLGHEATSDDVSQLALKLKRAIEVAVIASRPAWVATTGGETGSDVCEAMAFADFLPLAMAASDEEANLTAELAVCIMDSVQGHVEAFLGPRYANLTESGTKERNLILLWYTPGHYQSLVMDDMVGSKVLMSYENFKELLTTHGVMYVETTE